MKKEEGKMSEVSERCELPVRKRSQTTIFFPFHF